MGIFVPGSRLNTWRDVPLEPGPIAVLSQSGGFAEDIPYYGDLRGLRFSKVVSYGNGLDVDESELLEYFAQDVETEIIAAYIEGVKDGRRFIKALKEAAARKPVVIYKGGATRAGKRAAQGHTASLAGATDIFQTVCRQTNVIQVNNLDEMLDMLVALRFTRPFPRSTGAGVVGRGGGISVLSGDEIELSGLKLPLLSAEVQTELKKILPVPGSIFGNPVDSSALTSPEAILPTMRLVGQVADISILVYHLGFHPSSRWGDGRLASPDVLKALTDALSQAQQSMGEPVIVALHPAPALAEMKDFLAAQEAFVQAGFPVFYSMRQAGTAMARLIAWNNRRNTAR
jgi:acyl-CoA synthetase (NDP forming)